MAMYMLCAVYMDIFCTMQVEQGRIYISLESKKEAEKISLSLHPMQAKIFAEALGNLAGSVAVQEIRNTDFLGAIEIESKSEKEEEHEKSHQPVA